MPDDLLRDLLTAIPPERLMEITLECAPGTLTAGKIDVWRRCGVNRVSLGVQSFVTRELRQTGRRHTAEAVQSDIELLRQGGIENINVDLIAGLPNQTMESWKESLDWIDRLAPPHASVYIFEIDEESRLGKETLLGGVRYGADSLPGEDLTADLYETAVQRLRSAGLGRYEISNFARAGWQSRHNLKYWELETYVGFGLDAHSFDGRRRWGNPHTMATYLTQVEEGASLGPPEFTMTNRSEEHFFVGLRLEQGIEPTAEEWSTFARPIERWLSEGMLERQGGNLRLSDRGVLVSNEIFQEFLHV